MKMNYKNVLFLLMGMNTFLVQAQDQDKQESEAAKILDSVSVNAYMRSKTHLSDVQGTYIFSGKKTEVINLGESNINLSDKIARQIFAKVPGIFVYDMDGSGNQVNIAARGLDPHRGWEFNIRKDGVLTNSDMYGYPASHYSMPLESIESIELVRGTGALQYGAQFGGMLNYVTKQGDTTRPFSFESINTIGSFNLVNSYNAIGGKIGKWKYYAYINKKGRDGYRDNEHTDSESEDVVLTYEPNSNFSLRLEWARSKYLYRIPGPLTDKMFQEDPTQATRSRNYFSPDIHVPSVIVNWQVAPQTKLQLTTSAVVGKRNSVQFDKPTNVADTINRATMQYNNRQVDVDAFNSYTAEFRLLQQYKLGKQISTLTAGFQYMNNDLHRTQLGVGTTGSDYDLTLVTPGWGRDVHLKTSNAAMFAENNFQLSDKFSVNVGARVEMGETKMSGTITYYPENDIPVKMDHHFPLFGAGFSYKAQKNAELYGGVSQAYHPMLFKDLIPSSLYEVIDPEISDADGYNAELGFRGNWKFLRWDVTGFLLQFNNRFGTLAQTDNTGTLYLYRTNIGNTLTKGAEIFIQGDWMLGSKTALSVFTSTAFMDARYTKGEIKSGNTNVSVKDNKVETVPNVITRNGATLRYKKLSVSALYSYTAKSFADALNTVEPPAATGAVGLVPSYGIFDLQAGFRISRTLELKLNSSNLTNKQYFTKRPSFYPGPGVWPSEGRSFSASFIVRL